MTAATGYIVTPIFDDNYSGVTTLPSYYTVLQGNFSANGSLSGSGIIVTNFGQSDVDLTISFTLSQGSEAALFFRVTDTSNYYSLDVTGQASAVTRYDAGSGTVLARSTTGHNNTNAVFRVLCLGETMQFFINGTHLSELDQTGQTFNESATMHGAFTAENTDGITSWVQRPGAAVTAVGNVTSATITGLLDLTPYAFDVTATNDSGAGTPSGISNIVIPVTPPAPVTNLIAMPGPAYSGYVDFSWTAPTTFGSYPFYEYGILHGKSTTAIMDATTTTYRLTGVGGASNDTLSIVVTSQSGSTQASSTTADITFNGPVGYVAPTITVTPTDTSAMVSWTYPNGQPTPDSQTITVDTAGGGAILQGPTTIGAGVLSFTVTGLTANTGYRIAVDATYSGTVYEGIADFTTTASGSTTPGFTDDFTTPATPIASPWVTNQHGEWQTVAGGIAQVASTGNYDVAVMTRPTTLPTADAALEFSWQPDGASLGANLGRFEVDWNQGGTGGAVYLRKVDGSGYTATESITVPNQSTGVSHRIILARRGSTVGLTIDGVFIGSATETNDVTGGSFVIEAGFSDEAICFATAYAGPGTTQLMHVVVRLPVDADFGILPTFDDHFQRPDGPLNSPPYTAIAQAPTIVGGILTYAGSGPSGTQTTASIPVGTAPAAQTIVFDSTHSSDPYAHMSLSFQNGTGHYLYYALDNGTGTVHWGDSEGNSGSFGAAPALGPHTMEFIRDATAYHAYVDGSLLGSLTSSNTDLTLAQFGFTAGITASEFKVVGTGVTAVVSLFEDDLTMNGALSADGHGWVDYNTAVAVQTGTPPYLYRSSSTSITAKDVGQGDMEVHLGLAALPSSGTSLLVGLRYQSVDNGIRAGIDSNGKLSIGEDGGAAQVFGTADHAVGQQMIVGVLGSTAYITYDGETLTYPVTTASTRTFFAIRLDQNDGEGKFTGPIVVLPPTTVPTAYSPPGPVVNNSRATATPLTTASGTNVVDNTGYPAAPDPACGTNAGNAGSHPAYWTFTTSAACSVNLDTIGSNYDTVLRVFDTADYTTVVAYDDDGGGSSQSKLSNLTLLAGHTYMVIAGGYNGLSGAHTTLNWSGIAI